jgi:pyrimidine operon attenuation protein/uracil phosphoribosyltransferase
MNPNEIILDAADIQRVLVRISHRIIEIHKGTHRLVLIGIQTRGVFLARRIQTLIETIEGVKLPAGRMDITLYRDDWTRIGHHPVVQATEIPFSVDGKEVVLVDDVLFTGRTTRAAINGVMDYGRPDSIELAVLVDRGHRELPIEANYVGRRVETRRSEMITVQLSEYDGMDQVIIEKQVENEQQAT